jgi:hypothetical protein
VSITTIIIIVVAAVVILVLINLANKSTPKGVDKVYFKNEWKDIIALIDNPKTRPMSVINADKLLDEALKCLGLEGKTMAERLVVAKDRLKSRNAVWVAHKLRNKIVHESLFEPSKKDIDNAINGYRKAFKDLGVF